MAWFGAINVAFIVLRIVANEVARRRVRLPDARSVARALILISVARIAGAALFGLRAAMLVVGVTLLPALPLLARARRQAATSSD